MPSLRHIRKRIASVRNTEQITKAMKMVAAAKFRRAQEAVLAARPFSRELRSTLSRVARNKDFSDHALLARRDPVREDLYVLTSDRGLCGSFNSSVLRAVEHYLLDQIEAGHTVYLHTIGRKGYGYFVKQKIEVGENVTDLLDRPVYRRAIDLAEQLILRFTARQVDRVVLAFNEFRSAVQQQVVFRTLLPLDPPEYLADERELIDYIYEPARAELLDRLIRHYLANQIYMVVLESVASEHGARMTAMDNATNNANEMIDNLTLQYNKARQNAITRELMDIVGGAEALTG
ncbi:MAG: ATP synthase F1 subunit gamma [Deltaproteobacteria bacterium]|nr:ATP synthase F1 subunit gamma [Deltaproteobacteria bacterium]